MNWLVIWGEIERIRTTLFGDKLFFWRINFILLLKSVFQYKIAARTFPRLLPQGGVA